MLFYRTSYAYKMLNKCVYFKITKILPINDVQCMVSLRVCTIKLRNKCLLSFLHLHTTSSIEILQWKPAILNV